MPAAIAYSTRNPERMIHLLLWCTLSGGFELAGDRNPRRLCAGPHHVGIGGSLAQRVTEIDRRVGWPEDRGSISVIDDSPIASDESVSWVAEEDRAIGNSRRERIAPIEESRRLTVEPDLIGTTSVPVADHRLVTWVPEQE
jgi:hypothetical protein